MFRRLLLLFGALLCAVTLRAADNLPPKPERYFNDYTGTASPTVARALNEQLAEHERATSNQILVAIFPRLPAGAALEDFTVRTFHAWGVGQQGRNNGAVLFIFKDDHKLYLQVGYGLEGVLPDALCKRIIENEITPSFRQNHFDAGLRAGVNAILAAAQGEYKGTGRTVAERRGNQSSPIFFFVVGGIMLVLMIVSYFRPSQAVYDRRGRRWSGTSIGNTFSSGFGGWSSGGGGSSDSGSSFSGGGGDSGGGGAGGSW